MKYAYKMIQLPPSITVQEKDHKGTEAASYLENIANKMAESGWEFYRVDSIGVNVQPGCGGSLFGKKTEQYTYYVMTFRYPQE